MAGELELALRGESEVDRALVEGLWSATTEGCRAPEEWRTAVRDLIATPEERSLLQALEGELAGVGEDDASRVVIARVDSFFKDRMQGRVGLGEVSLLTWAWFPDRREKLGCVDIDDAARVEFRMVDFGEVFFPVRRFLGSEYPGARKVVELLDGGCGD